ncbi:MAG: CinA family nicotinamide mononucleotide deamidase-related protein, partial [Thermoguttaceae bacterium]
MIAEVISIGDELTSGQRLDTNSQWISQRLAELGVRVGFHTTVADDLAASIAIFQAAVGRADLVVTTGGLGPTADDLTRESLAAAAGCELVRNDDALETIREMFRRFGRKMPRSNELQAMFPAGSRPIPNAHGTAPGIAMEFARPSREPCRLFALPGVPTELFGMWQQSVAPAISAALPAGRVIRHRRIKCFGAGESKMEEMLPDLVRRGRTPSVGITASGATITLRITAEGANEEECHAAMEPTVATIRECLGTLVFGEEDDELEHAVARLLAERDATLAVAEWGTGGQIAHWLASVT